MGDNLKKYMKKKDIKPAPEWEGMEVEGHEKTSDNDFETKDTVDDPLEDHEGKNSKKAMSHLAKYQKMKKK